MNFSYKAISASGERVSGVYRAESYHRARQELGKRYPTLLELNIVDAGAEKPFRVREEGVALVFRRWATLLSSGVPIADVLDFLVTSESDERLREALECLAGRVQGGESLSSAMATPRLARAFDRVSIGLIKLGEDTGQLAKVTDRLAQLKERQIKLTRSLRATLTYPAVLLFVILAVTVLFSFVLGSGDNSLFSAFGTQLPWPTRVVQSASSMLKNPLVLLTAGCAILILAQTFRSRLRTNQPFRLWVHSQLLALPALGPLLQQIECARILFVLSDCLKVGIPVSQALALSRDVSNNEAVRLGLQKVLSMFCDGATLTEAFNGYPIFSPMILSMLEVGMESGQLDYILGQASESFEEDVQLKLEGIARLAEPVLLALAGAIAGFLAIATLLPIIQMVQKL